MNTIWHNAFKSFRTNVLIGLLLLTPLVGTLWVADLVITFISNHVVPSAWLASKYSPLYRVAAIIIVVAAFYFVGVLTRNFVGKKIYRLADWVLTRIPVINSVYTSIRQISESLVSSQSTLFKEVVAVQFPRLGLYSIGFVTSRVPAQIAHKLNTDGKSEMICVFVPTAPNPTTGFLLMLPKPDVICLNISVAAAMQLVISGGASSPWKPANTPQMSLLDHIEAWINRAPAPTPPTAENKPAESNQAPQSGAT